MNQKTFTGMASGLFLLIAALHVLRLVLRWDAVIGGWSVPHWISGVAVVLFGYLGYSGFSLRGK